ncbi:MAG: lysine--tRNA ligase [Candidatus Margulisiibacteriota bacterium]|nr:lysine--tRNA ligase [Candidatus Margulisiibacteriota bacterium]
MNEEINQSSESEFDVRNQKLTTYRDQGIEPFAYEFKRSHSIGSALALVDGLGAGEKTEHHVQLAGRVKAKRGHGKAIFANITDQTGSIQLYASVNDLDSFSQFEMLDVGDIIGVEGTIFCTRRGEISVNVAAFTLLTKSLHPLPEKYHGLQDKEARYRRRYVDLIANPDVMDVFKKRSSVIRDIRNYLADEEFMEVETPVLHHIYGGASARPFTTHHNELKQNLYLRIALELHLKRLIVGGFEKIFEIGRVFRNEGVSFKHNPEYTLLELYQAYADYSDMMSLTENLMNHLVVSTYGSETINYQGQELNFSLPFKRISMRDAILEHSGLDIDTASNEDMLNLLKTKGIELADDSPKGELINEVYDTFVEHQLIQPTFIVDYPLETSPLAKKNRQNPAYVERFELIINKMEIANAFTELNDPIDQKERFEAQQVAREAGFEEAHQMDEDFIEALSYGMPPTGGLGIGIDRVVMLLTDTPSIRDVLFFPHLKHIS